MVKKRTLISLLFVPLLLLIVVASCTKKSDLPDPTIPKKDDSPIEADSTCGLTKVYRDNKNANAIVTMFHKTGYGSDTVYYYNRSDSSLINYTTFLYNQRGGVIERKIFDAKNVLETKATYEYWPNNKPKFEKVERKKIETLNDQTNMVQESSFDEQGNIVEYKNFNYKNVIVNHLVYTNTYSNGVLQKSVREDQLYNFDGSSEYTYNAKGLKISIINKNQSGTITGKIEFSYDQNNKLIGLKNYSGTNLSLEESYDLNKNGVMLKMQSRGNDGSIQSEHYYQYNCGK